LTLSDKPQSSHADQIHAEHRFGADSIALTAADSAVLDPELTI